MSEYKIEIPKLDRTSYQCPCSPFVKGIGACACDNIKYESKNARSDAFIVLNVQGTTYEVITRFGVTKRLASTGPKTKSLEEMKLEHPPSYYGMKKI